MTKIHLNKLSRFFVEIVVFNFLSSKCKINFHDFLLNWNFEFFFKKSRQNEGFNLILSRKSIVKKLLFGPKLVKGQLLFTLNLVENQLIFLWKIENSYRLQPTDMAFWSKICLCLHLWFPDFVLYFAGLQQPRGRPCCRMSWPAKTFCFCLHFFCFNLTRKMRIRDVRFTEFLNRMKITAGDRALSSKIG